MHKKRIEIRTICKLLLFCLFILVLVRFGCPFYEILEITCPCCGTTRGWMAFFRSDYALALRCNAFFWLVPLLILGYLGSDFLQGRKKQRLEWALLIGAVLLSAYNCLRWFHLVALP